MKYSELAQNLTFDANLSDFFKQFSKCENMMILRISTDTITISTDSVDFNGYKNEFNGFSSRALSVSPRGQVLRMY